MSMTSTDLAGRRIVLTGGTTGIGRATLLRLVEAGAQVLTFGRDRSALDDALGSADGSTAPIGIVADVAARDGVDAVFAAVDERLGGIDVLVACAAVGARPIHEMGDDDWRYVIEANLTGYLACARAAILRMTGRGGHLLFVGSISTEIKAAGESVYAATKAGIQAFAETLRKEVAGKGIKVSVVQPGSVATDMQECGDREKHAAVANGRMLVADDIADAIMFVLTRSPTCDVVNLRLEPLLQKTS